MRGAPGGAWRAWSSLRSSLYTPTAFPENLTPGRPRPVLRLLDEGQLPIVYPLEALRDARKDGDTYLLTDSHLTPRGNRLLAAATMRELGASPTLLHEVDDHPGRISAAETWVFILPHR